MSKKISQKIIQFTFQRMLRLTKIQINSLPFTTFILGLQTFFGAFLIMGAFFAVQGTEPSFTDPILNIITMDDGDVNSNGLIVTIIFTFLNLLTFSLFMNFFKKSSSETIDKILLILFFFLQAFRYMLIVVVCSIIQKLFNSRDVLLILVNSINLILIISWNIIFQTLYFTLNYNTKNYMARFYSPSNIIMDTILMCLSAIFALIGHQTLSLPQKIIFNIIILLFKSSIIYTSMLKWYYVNTITQCIYGFIVMNQVIALLANLIVGLTNQNLLKINFNFCVITTSLFCFFAWKAYFDWSQEDIHFSQGKDIKSQSKVAMYFKALWQTSIQAQSMKKQSLVLSSIRKQHQIKCTNSKCYCKSQKQNYSFVRQYTMQQLQSIRINFKNKPKILIQQINFKFQLYKVYPDILTRLTAIKNHSQLSLTDHYNLLSLKNDLIKWIKERNVSCHAIGAETPLQLEQITKQLEGIIKKDIEKKSKKWKYLSRGICRTQELEQDTTAEINFLKSITQIHSKWIYKFKRSSIFNFLLMFHYKKVSFLSVKIDDITKNLRQHLKKIKDQELSSTKQFAKCIFHKRSCIIESLVDEQNMGIVTRASKNVNSLFGYQPNKIIGMNLNRLMPNFMAAQHDLILGDWVKTGTWRTIGKLKQIFCIHKEQFCFNALIYLKLIANQKGLFFVTVLFKKNESDYLILNQKQQIQGIGRKFLHMIGQNCRRLPIKILIDDFPSQQVTNAQDYKSYVSTFRSLKNNQHIVEEFLESKNHHFLNQQEEKLFIKQYQEKLQNSDYLQKWQVKFDLKIYKMRQVKFYVFLLNYARRINNEQSKNSFNTLDQGKCQIIIGHGRMNQDQQCDLTSSNNASSMTVREQKSQFFQEKNSSMASFAERQSFTLTKLLTIFYQLLIQPKQIKDKRINTLNISTLIQTIILTTIVVLGFYVYINSLNEIESYVSANAQINQNMQLAILMYNKIISVSQYQNDTITLNKFLDFAQKDMDDFYNDTRVHLLNVNTAISEFHGQHLYAHLTEQVPWLYQRKQSIHVQVLQFLQFYYYLTKQIQNDVSQDSSVNILVDREYQLDRIKQNFPYLKKLSYQTCQSFISLTQKSQSDLILVAWLVMTSFLLITFLFFLYTYNYHSFRYEQKYQALEIYKTIPPIFIDKIKQYYLGFYMQLFLSPSKTNSIQSSFENLNKNQLQIDEHVTSSAMNNNKIKFLGKQKFLGWIASLIIFLAINTVNILITYQIVKFVSPLGTFIRNINSIMDSQNKILETYLDIKGAYLLAHKPTINLSVIDPLLELMTQNEVTFNQMVTFQSQTLSIYDPTFYDDFYKMLVENVCDQIRQDIDQEQYEDCILLSQKGMIQDGIITYMNHFQRRLRSVLEDLKVNSTLRLTSQGKQYFMNRGFKEIDLTMSYSIKIFRLLILRILQGYNKGISYISSINIIVLVLLISPQIIGLIMWFHLVKKQKQKLSLLYGSMLMIPPNVIKYVKNLPRITKRILEFEEI